MTVSFYINKNDIQELSYLEENFMLIPFDEETRNKAVVIECFNTIDEIKRLLNQFRLDIRFVPNTNFIQVNIDYLKFDKIKEYLKF